MSDKTEHPHAVSKAGVKSDKTADIGLSTHETEAATTLQAEQHPHLNKDLSVKRQPLLNRNKSASSVVASSTSYSPQLADKICEGLSQGRTLRAVCASKLSFPAPHIVRQWAMEDIDGFASKYARARELGFLNMADELIEIVDREDGNITRDKLRADTRKWLLSKAMPKGFGDIPEMTTSLRMELDENDFEMGKKIAFALELSSRAAYTDEADE